MSAKVNVTQVEVLNNPATFHSNFQFRLVFECHEPLPNDLEWKLTYVGSAESDEHDQVLDTVLVGPVPEGRHQFLFEVTTHPLHLDKKGAMITNGFEADPPDASRVPDTELVGVTVVLLSCSYMDRDFIKIGYFVRHEYDNQEMKDNPPDKVDVDKLTRFILAEEPRVTRMNIPWSEEEAKAAEAAAQAAASQAESTSNEETKETSGDGDTPSNQENQPPESEDGEPPAKRPATETTNTTTAAEPTSSSH